MEFILRQSNSTLIIQFNNNLLSTIDSSVWLDEDYFLTA